MTTTILGLLAVFLFDFSLQSEPSLPSDFSVQKTEGKWYLSGRASNAKLFEMNKLKTIATVVLIPTADGGMHMNTSLVLADVCVKKHHVLKTTEIPGKFTLSTASSQVQNEFQMLDVKYDEYMIVRNKRTKSQKVMVIYNFYTRKPEVSPALKKLFTSFSLRQKIALKNIIFFSSYGECN